MTATASYERIEYGVGGHRCPHCDAPAELRMVQKQPVGPEVVPGQPGGPLTLLLEVASTCVFPYCSQACRQEATAFTTAGQVAEALGG